MLRADDRAGLGFRYGIGCRRCLSRRLGLPWSAAASVACRLNGTYRHGSRLFRLWRCRRCRWGGVRRSSRDNRCFLHRVRNHDAGPNVQQAPCGSGVLGDVAQAIVAGAKHCNHRVGRKNCRSLGLYRRIRPRRGFLRGSGLLLITTTECYPVILGIGQPYCEKHDHQTADNFSHFKASFENGGAIRKDRYKTALL
jgi:hypothetical protein